MPPVICGHRVGTPRPGCSPTQHQCWQSKELHRTRGAQQSWDMWRGSYRDCGHYCGPMGSGLTAGGIQIPGINHRGTPKASCQLPGCPTRSVTAACPERGLQISHLSRAGAQDRAPQAMRWAEHTFPSARQSHRSIPHAHGKSQLSRTARLHDRW